MSDLPDPLVPADVDCTDLDGFMLNVERLMASELVALSSHEVVGAALFLWCRAWKQRPAASLPDDERVLSAFARLPLPRFRKLREEVMRGFVKCSDGRFYHPVVAAEAINAYARKQAFRRKRDTDAERLRKWRDGRRETPDDTPNETQGETRFVAEGQGQGQGQGQGHIEPSLRSGPVGAPPSTAEFDLHMDFERWWEQYPRHRRGPKGPASKKFLSIVKRRKATVADLMAGLGRYNAAGYFDSEYACGAERWLNSEQWTVEHFAPPGDKHTPRAPPANGHAPTVSASRLLSMFAEDERNERDRSQARAAGEPDLLLPAPEPPGGGRAGQALPRRVG